MTSHPPKSILARLYALKGVNGGILVALLLLPFGFYKAAASFSEQATIGMLMGFALLMLLVMLEK